MNALTAMSTAMSQVRRKARYWSGAVTEHSNALDLEAKIFSAASPRRIAASLKRSAEISRRRKGTPFRSAMSMLNFFINRAGTTLSNRRRHILEAAKPELRKAFGRPEPAESKGKPM